MHIANPPLTRALTVECQAVVLLRRSYDGVAAVNGLRRPAPSRSFCASHLSDATRRMRRLSSISPRVPPVLIQNSMVVGSWPTVLGHPPGPVIMFCGLKILKRVFPFTRPMRGVLGEGRRWGGPQRGGPSWWSWQMTLSPLHMLPSRTPHEEQGQ